jgi:MFS family permease
MNLTPSENLTDEQRKSGLKLIVKDGLAAEAMATLSGGAFLVSLALNFGASNFQIGLLAALPTLANIFQIAAIYLVYHYANRRAITVYSSLFARLPILLIGFLPFMFSAPVCLNLLILLLFFHYMFGGMSGCSWNSWMKDLVPEEMLGTYFSNRSRLIQILSISLSLACAFLLDHIKTRYPAYEISTYSGMFFIGGICGLYGIYMLIKTPEPKIIGIKTNLLKLFKNPLKNVNFRNLLIFNSCWAFAVNLAAPFFSVYLLKMLHMKLSYVVAFSILSQITSILFIRVWGKYSDRYSNKSILRICGPLYLACILAWTFTTMPQEHLFTIPLLVLIYIFNGISTSGINLALSNIGMKLAPREGDAIVYLTAKGMINALFAGIAPVIGGFFADFFATRELSWNIEWKSPTGNLIFHTLELQQWDFFFLFAFVLGIFALYRLTFVKEKGEVRKKVIMTEIFSELKSQLATSSSLGNVKSMVQIPLSFYSLMKRKKKVGQHKRKKSGNAKELALSDEGNEKDLLKSFTHGHSFPEP